MAGRDAGMYAMTEMLEYKRTNCRRAFSNWIEIPHCGQPLTDPRQRQFRSAG
jgi:hypothetical protein